MLAKSSRWCWLTVYHPAFRYLEGSDQVLKEPDGDFDTFITVDCADFKRLGKPFQSLRAPDINIDHHITNERFGKINLIEGQEVATAAILTNHLPAWGFEITRPIAAALLTGIITDTLGFRTSNMTSDALRQSAALMDTGVDMSELVYARTCPPFIFCGSLLGSGAFQAGIIGWHCVEHALSCRTGKQVVMAGMMMLT